MVFCIQKSVCSRETNIGYFVPTTTRPTKPNPTQPKQKSIVDNTPTLSQHQLSYLAADAKTNAQVVFFSLNFYERNGLACLPEFGIILAIEEVDTHADL